MGRRHTLRKFGALDVAQAIGISTRTLARRCRERRLRLEEMTFGELVELVESLREAKTDGLSR